MLNNIQAQKSALLFLVAIGVLVIVTLTFGSAYFIKPKVEAELKETLLNNFTKLGITHNVVSISGRDITLTGSVGSKKESTLAEGAALAVQGVRQVNNNLVIKNQTIE